ncbi:hypothetical protein ACX4ER_003907 [Cronobacter dublinensis]
MSIDTAKMKAAAERQKSVLEYIASFEPADIDSDTVDLRFEDENGCDTGCDVSIVEECRRSADLVGELIVALEAAQKRNAELERELAAFRPVGVMSEAAFHRLEASECRFIALWPRPGIYLPRSRPKYGVVVYARTGLAGSNLEAGRE